MMGERPTISSPAVSDSYAQDEHSRHADEDVMSPTRPREQDPQALLPLKPIELLVLTMLSGSDRHGYGLRQDIVDHTNGRVALEAGNLYRYIRRLESEGLVGETEPRRSSDRDDERRIYYRLLPFGRRVLAAELLRLQALMRMAESNRVIAPVRA